MESYGERVSRFNNMLSTTQEHIAAVRDAATKFKDANDPVGLGLSVTGETAGGVSGLASAYAGIQHFKDFKKMYKGVTKRLGNLRSDNPNGSSSGSPADGADDSSGGAGQGGSSRGANSNSSGSGQADGDGASGSGADQGTGQAASSQGSTDIDGGINDRIENLNDNPFPTAEANDINSGINEKISNLSSEDVSKLNSAIRAGGRSRTELDTINKLPEGDAKVAAQQDFLKFKNNVANDAQQRAANGRPRATQYDRNGNPTAEEDAPPSQGTPDAVRATPDSSGPNAVAPDNDVNLAPDANAPSSTTTASGDSVTTAQTADSDASGLIARGRAALSRLQGGQDVPAQGGGQVQGLRTDVSQHANAGSRVQQQSADDAQNSQAPGRDPNGSGQRAGDGTGAGEEGGGSSVNPGQGSSSGGAAADAEGAVQGPTLEGAPASVIESTAGDTAEATAGAVGAGLDEAAAFAGPAAPFIGLIGGLISLGTTIAGLFHHKPPPKKEAPPPATTQQVGGNLKDAQSGMGAGIF